MKASKNKLSH